jgi:hypothetical protein
MVQKELRKLSQWFWKGLLKLYDEGRENGITSKKIFKVEVFFSSQNIDFPFIWRDSWSFSFSSSFFLFLPFSFFFLLRLLRTWGFWWYLRRKSLLQKLLFKWLDMEWHGHGCGYIGGGRIFQNEVMHTNIAKPWLWRSGSCGCIGGGHIFQSEGMHANISGWG